LIDRYAGLHALVPVLGLAGIVLAAGALLTASASPATAFFIAALMSSLMVGAGVLAIVVPLMGRETMEVTFVEREKTIHLVYRGLLAHSTWSMPLGRASGARMAISYDATGTKRITPMLDLTDGRSIELPPGTTYDDIAAIRSIIARNAPPPPARQRTPRETARARYLASRK